jgi:hypothetical protein
MKITIGPARPDAAMLAHAAMISSRIVNDTVNDDDSNDDDDDDDDINGPLLPNDIRYSDIQHRHQQTISDSQVPLMISFMFACNTLHQNVRVHIIIR